MPAATASVRNREILRMDRWLRRLFVLGLLVIVTGIFTVLRDEIARSLLTQVQDILVFIAIVMVTDSMDVEVEGLRLTLDFPLLLAVAVLYSPALAMLVGLVASMDWREIRRGREATWNLLFNRGQIAVSVFLAGSTLQLFAPDLEPLLLAAVGTVAALLVDYVVNTSLVAVHLNLRDGNSPKRTMSALWIRVPTPVLATYLGYGCLGLLLAYLGRDVGLWSIVAFLIPTIAAQRLLVATLKLRDLTRQLEVMRRHVERLIDQVGEERRDERRRISGDLHDDVLQSLLRISILGKLLQKRMPREVGADPDVQDMITEAAACISQLRSVIHDLRHSVLGGNGLAESIRGLVSDLTKVSGPRILLDVRDDLALAEETQVVAYQVAREGINNSLRHSNAKQISLKLSRAGLETALEVVDDGSGFEPQGVDRARHFGLDLCRERVARVGGRLTITSNSNGTSLRATFPTIRQP